MTELDKSDKMRASLGKSSSRNSSILKNSTRVLDRSIAGSVFFIINRVINRIPYRIPLLLSKSVKLALRLLKIVTICSVRRSIRLLLSS